MHLGVLGEHLLLCLGGSGGHLLPCPRMRGGHLPLHLGVLGGHLLLCLRGPGPWWLGHMVSPRCRVSPRAAQPRHGACPAAPCFPDSPEPLGAASHIGDTLRPTVSPGLVTAPQRCHWGW